MPNQSNKGKTKPHPSPPESRPNYRFSFDSLDAIQRLFSVGDKISDADAATFAPGIVRALSLDSQRLLDFVGDSRWDLASPWPRLLALAVIIANGDDHCREQAAVITPRVVTTPEHFLYLVDQAKAIRTTVARTASTAPSTATVTSTPVPPPPPVVVKAPRPQKRIFEHGQFTGALLTAIKKSRKPLNPREATEAAAKTLGLDMDPKEFSGLVAKARTVLARPHDGLIRTPRDGGVYYSFK